MKQIKSWHNLTSSIKLYQSCENYLLQANHVPQVQHIVRYTMDGEVTDIQIHNTHNTNI